MSKVSMKNVVLDMTKLSTEKQAEYAKTFCEGSTDLEELLKYLWSNGVNTFASCAGHLAEINDNKLVAGNKPYIHFDTSTFTQTQMQNLMQKLIGLNELRDKKYLTFDVGVQQFNERERREGFVGENEQERHSMTIRFKDIYRADYKELLKVFESVKTNENALLTKLKSKFNKENKSISGFKQFIETASQLNNVDLIAAKSTKYDMIKLSYTEKGLTQSIMGIRPDNTTIHQYVNSAGEIEFLETAKGYATPTSDGKFLTVFGGVIELEKDEIQGLKPFDFDKNDSWGDFNAETMKQLIEKLDKTQTNSLTK